MTNQTVTSIHQQHQNTSTRLHVQHLSSGFWIGIMSPLSNRNKKASFKWEIGGQNQTGCGAVIENPEHWPSTLLRHAPFCGAWLRQGLSGIGTCGETLCKMNSFFLNPYLAHSFAVLKITKDCNTVQWPSVTDQCILIYTIIIIKRLFPLCR